MPLPGHTLAELLPSRQYNSVADGEPAKSLVALVIQGSVSDVREGYGYRAAEDSAGGEQVSFDDPEALWRTVTATVDVERVVDRAPAGTLGDPAPDLSVGEEVEVRFSVGMGADLTSMRLALMSLDSPILYLDPAPLPNESEVFRVAGLGNLIVTTGLDGSLQLAGASPDERADLLAADSDTLTELLDSADDTPAPQTVVGADAMVLSMGDN